MPRGMPADGATKNRKRKAAAAKSLDDQLDAAENECAKLHQEHRQTYEAMKEAEARGECETALLQQLDAIMASLRKAADHRDALFEDWKRANIVRD